MLNNEAGTDGGGIANFGTLNVAGATINGNDVTRHDGGGVYNTGTATLTGCTISNNSTGLDGGGIANMAGGDLTVTDCTLNQDHAGHDGGAIYDRGTERIDPTTLTGNTAGDKGGGFYEVGGAGETFVNDFTENGDYATGQPELVVGSGVGAASSVKIVDPNTDAVKMTFAPYQPGFTGGISVAHGWGAGSDGVPREVVVTATGAGVGPHIKVFDIFSGHLLREFYAYDSKFTGGVRVALGDSNGDGMDDIITAVISKAGPHVKAFDGYTGQEIRSFYAYDPKFMGGVTISAGDINGDGVADIVTGAASGAASHVKVFSGTNNAVLRSFLAYDAGFKGGVTVAVGDVDGDGKADIITGAGAGGGPNVKVFSGADGTKLAEFAAYDPKFLGGVNVGTEDLNHDGRVEIVTGSRAGAHVKTFDLTEGAAEIDSFTAFAAFNGGVSVG